MAIPGTLKHSLRKRAIATVEVPDRVCGMARRIGILEIDLAVYRLRVKPDYRHTVVTLASFFALEKGIFRVYEPKSDHKPASSPQGSH